MSIRPLHHRFPRAGLDPLDSIDRMLPLVRTLVSDPPVPETFVVALDDARRGLAIAHVTGTTDPDHVLTVVERFAVPDLCGGGGAGIVVVTCRPGGRVVVADIDRWLEMSDLCDDAGIELVEWFVVARTITCPRDLLGAPPR